MVGGAGSLVIAPEVQLVDTPEFPDSYEDEALAGREFLNVLRTENELKWTFLSSSAFSFRASIPANFVSAATSS